MLKTKKAKYVKRQERKWWNDNFMRRGMDYLFSASLQDAITPA